jgi:predicted nucleotidyltransferase
MNTKELAERNLIYKVRTGSHAYGTALPSSDEDYAGIYIPPIDYYFGLQSFDILCSQEEEDKSYYSLRKYANLAVANNPNVLELLFTREFDIYLSTPASNKLRVHRSLFLSQLCQKTFLGYAKAQLHRIRNHTKWLEQEIQDMNILTPLILAGNITEDWVAWRFGENMVDRLSLFMDPLSWRKDTIGYHEDQVLLTRFAHSNIICPEKTDRRFYKTEDDVMCTDVTGVPFKTQTFQKHLYDEAKKKRDQYVTWMAERNPARHETELKFGYDTKHAMHLVRLLRMGYEILTQGEFIVYRPDAKELLDIRAGLYSYKDITEYADEMVDKINNIQAGSFAVPPTPSTSRINTMVVEITREYLEGYHGDNT